MVHVMCLKDFLLSHWNIFIDHAHWCLLSLSFIVGEGHLINDFLTNSSIVAYVNIIWSVIRFIEHG